MSLRICFYIYIIEKWASYDAGFMMVLLINNFRITMCNPIPPFILRLRSHHRLLGDKRHICGTIQWECSIGSGGEIYLMQGGAMWPCGAPPPVVSWFINCSRPPLVALKYRELSRII